LQRRAHRLEVFFGDVLPAVGNAVLMCLEIHNKCFYMGWKEAST
jgi:hypothetical protein